MPKGKITMEMFCNPPEKVQRMFRAVSELVRERPDSSSIKVQDITERAGIGKGTAYEYFSSREEIIMMALFYEYGTKLAELQNLVEQTSRFEDKMFRIIDWLYEHQDYNRSFMQIIRADAGGNSVCLKEQMPRELFDGMNEFLYHQADELLELGYMEGAFTETDTVKRRLAFLSMVFQLVMSFQNKKENKFLGMEYQKAREYAYRTMIKTLT